MDGAELVAPALIHAYKQVVRSEELAMRTKNGRSGAGKRPSDLSDAELQRWLGPTATTPERIEALLHVGIPPADMARSLGVSPSTLRNWSSGQAKPRPNVAITLDDLRATTLTLLKGGLERERVVSWLTSRGAGDLGDRPVDVLPYRPTHVLTAAQAEVLRAAAGRDD